MPGTWTAADIGDRASRPGFYVNFQEIAQQVLSPGTTGIVGIVESAHWGPVGEVVRVTIDNYQSIFRGFRGAGGNNIADMIYLAFVGGAQQVHVVRADSTSTSASLSSDIGKAGADSLVVTAKYKGIYGNQIWAKMEAATIGGNSYFAFNVYDTSVANRVERHLILQSEANTEDEIDEWCSTITEESDYVSIANTNNLSTLAVRSAADSPIILAGGTDVAPSATNYNDALNALATSPFDKARVVTSSAFTSAALRTAFGTWITNQRREGYYVSGVLGDNAAFSKANLISYADSLDNPGITLVGPGATLRNRLGVLTAYTANRIAGMVAGIIANAPERSITFADLPRTTALESYISNADVRDLLESGVCVLTQSTTPGVSARVERGVTTIQQDNIDHPSDFRKIRIVRIVDNISQGIGDALSNNYVGSMINDEQGRGAILSAIREFLTSQVVARNIDSDFVVSLDDSMDSTNGDEVFINIGIRPVDAVEFIYTTLRLS